MKVAIDCRMINNAGIGTYLRNLISAIELQATGIKLTLFGEVNKLDSFKKHKIVNYPAKIYSLNELTYQGFSSSEFDVVHIPHFNAPFKKPKKLIITIHDLIYIKLPESRNYFKGLAANYLLKNALNKADKIIAVSKYTKNDIINFSPASADKIEVIYEASDPIFHRIKDKEILESFKEKYNLPDKFILFVGTLKKHKNINVLLEAYSLIKKENPEYKLVVTGKYRPQEPEILNEIKKTDAFYLGEVSNEDLVKLYNCASLMVMPSLYEGFGLPILEAFKSGIPVIASNATSIPEISSKAAMLFDPRNPQELANKITQIILDKTLAGSLIEKGTIRAEEFSWAKTALETINLYRELVK